jgi:pimeloyl-ACP methyl ester carboxylesterase
MEKWQDSGYLPVYHYGEGKILSLDYGFCKDVSQYQEEYLQRRVPTLIIHGVDDEVIPIKASREYTRSRSWVQLLELSSDHTLSNVLPEIWRQIQDFCQIN